MLLLRPTSFMLRPRSFLPNTHLMARTFHRTSINLSTASNTPPNETNKTKALREPEIKTAPEEPKPNPTVLKVIEKLPKSFQKYGHRLVNSPVSHITSFLLLHELSAVIPFLGLWYIFHEFQFLPADIPSWIIIKGARMAEAVLGDTINNFSLADRTKLIIEGATAYGIVKALFPFRVVASIFLTPWFARVFVNPVFNLFRRVVGMKKKQLD